MREFFGEKSLVAIFERADGFCDNFIILINRQSLVVVRFLGDTFSAKRWQMFDFNFEWIRTNLAFWIANKFGFYKTFCAEQTVRADDFRAGNTAIGEDNFDNFFKEFKQKWWKIYLIGNC